MYTRELTRDDASESFRSGLALAAKAVQPAFPTSPTVAESWANFY